MALEGGYLNIDEDGKLFLSCFVYNDTVEVKNEELKEELKILLFSSVRLKTIKKAIFQLSEEQHLSEPRILITTKNSTRVVEFSKIKIKNPALYKSLLDFKEKLLNYLLTL